MLVVAGEKFTDSWVKIKENENFYTIEFQGGWERCKPRVFLEKALDTFCNMELGKYARRIAWEISILKNTCEGKVKFKLNVKIVPRSREINKSQLGMSLTREGKLLAGLRVETESVILAFMANHIFLPI